MLVNSTEYTTLVWYSSRSDARTEAGFYEATLSWMRAVGLPPDLLSVHAPGFSGKPASFEKGHLRLRERGFSSVKGLSLFALSPNARIPLRDFTIMASYAADQEFALLAATSELLSLSEPSTTELATQLVATLEPQYGIGYARAQRLGPAMYAIGIVEGLELCGEEDEEAFRISRWNDAMDERAWQNGLLRDVYPWNFLNRTQRGMSVEGLPLERWIGCSSGRGSLIELTTEQALWRLDPGQIPAVQAVLDRAGLIFHG